MKEYTLSVDLFEKPHVLTDEHAIYVMLIKLIMTEPGSLPMHPECGVGIVSRYRESDHADLDQLRIDIIDQCTQYLPELSPTSIEVSDSTETVIIQITVDGLIYKLIYDKKLKTLSEVS